MAVLSEELNNFVAELNYKGQSAFDRGYVSESPIGKFITPSGYGYDVGDILDMKNPDGQGLAYGNGCGYGDRNGAGRGEGYGYGRDLGVSHPYNERGVHSINGHQIFEIDKTPTIITHIRGDIAKGFVVGRNLSLTPCYIVKGHGLYAHGDTIHQAWGDLQKKIMMDDPVEVRIKKFMDEHSDPNSKYPAKNLFVWHNLLTGSCRFGRTTFCKDHHIDINKDSFTIREFVDLTEGHYGWRIIDKLKEAYQIS